MNLLVASCLVCGEEKELCVWVDPAITGGSYHGVCCVCFQCRQAVQQMRAGGQSLSPLAKKEVEEIVMRALATGSV